MSGVCKLYGMRQSSGRASGASSIAGAFLVLAFIGSGCGASSLFGDTQGRSTTRGASTARVDATATEVMPASAEITADGSTEAEAPLPPGARVYAYDGSEKIYVKPDTESPPIGLIRAGASVPLAKEEPLSGLGVGLCKGNFYAVKPRGYVCTGRHSTLDGTDPRVRAAREVLPKADSPLPYRVGILVASSPQYGRIPTADEQRKHEPGLDAYLAKRSAGKIVSPKTSGSFDDAKANRGPSKAFTQYVETAKPSLLSEEEAYEGRKMSFSAEFDVDGRTFLVTPNLTLVPKDKVYFVDTPKLKGVNLKSGELKFPFGYTWIQDTAKLKKQQDGEFKETGDVYPRQTFVQLEGEIVRGKRGANYWKTADGSYIRNELVTVFKANPELPKNVGKNDKWVDVRVTWGTLVAYEGTTAVFATAVSPGQDGISARSHGHPTTLGQYQIGWKLGSADMSGVEKRKPWAVDDVPFVAYYKDNYAVHAAWWHDDFGRPKSHGCVNVAPNDAHWLWHWMDPVMPEGWYGVASYRPEAKGTTILVRP
ncbi:MAG: L,D-transpeptidase [Polyangiaceae bacterium]|nr:L,D-transpeptidase [Polyangiaceae bacterium]